MFFAHIRVCVLQYWSKGLCRLRPEPHNELELIRARDWGRWIIWLFRLALLPKHQRHVAQFERIMVTVKPEASLFISAAHEAGTADVDEDDELTEHSPTLLNQTWNTLCVRVCLSAFCLCYLNVQHTFRGQLGASCSPHVSKITSSGHWSNVTGPTLAMLCAFLFVKVSSQGGCVFVLCM